jgi:hypothetical protein
MAPERPATEGPEFACFSRLLTQDFIVFRNLQAARSAREKSARFLRAQAAPNDPAFGLRAYRLYQRIVDDLNKLMVAVGLKAA